VKPDRRGTRNIRHVALIYDATRAYDLKVMTGVAAYLQEGAGWNVYIEENSLKDQRLPDLRTWKGDGIIADFDNPRVAAAVVESKLPAVAFGSGYGWYAPESRIPYFFTNNRAIAHLAADHLLDRGFRNFAFCGYPRTPINGWSEERERAFVARLKRRGLACQVYRGPHTDGRGWTARQSALRQWLEALPKPRSPGIGGLPGAILASTGRSGGDRRG
jgi:LacI family transcriptional regulator